jgi:DNA repair ATPase RecN
LSDFYKNQIKTWEALRKAVDRFKPNQTALDKDEDASKALRRMNEILATPSPYKMLKEVSGLISRVEAVNDTMVEETRESAVEEVDRKIAGVVSLLDEKYANDDLRNKALFPLQKIKKKILAEDSMPNMAYQVNEAEEQHLNAFEVIDDALKPSDKDPKPMKKIKVINAASLASRIYMETEADVNEYVDKVRIELMDAVKNNIRVRIE